MTHVPCPGTPGCGSSDAGWQFPDGGVYCYKCRAYVGEGQPPAAAESDDPRLLQVRFRAFPNRGLTEEICRRYGYGASTCNGQPVQVAPYHDAAGQLVAQKLRFADKTFAVRGDLKKAGLFGQPLWAAGGRHLTITEGEIDALSFAQVWGGKWPAVSVQNGAQAAAASIKRSLDWVESFERVVLAFDNDEPGRAAALECAALLSPGKAFICTLPLKDANEMLLARRTEDLVRCFWEAREHRPDGVLVGDEILEEALRWEKSSTLSIPYSHPGLQLRTMGFRKGELTVICAGTAVGKTTWCRELTRDFLEAGEKVGYISLEEPVRDVLLGTCTTYLNRPLHQQADPLADPAVLAQWGKVKDRMVVYNHSGRLDAGNIQEKIRYMARARGCGIIFLDNLSVVIGGTSTENERQTIDQLMVQMVGLSKEIGLGLIVVCHLRRPQQGASHTEGRRVSLADLRGSGLIESLSNNVFALERDQSAEDGSELVTDVRVLKCRHTGRVGHAGTLVYDRQTGRFLPGDVEFGPVGTGDCL